VSTYIANLPAEEIIALGTKGNLRSYIAEYNPRQRNRVHDAIADTIEFAPAIFKRQEQQLLDQAKFFHQDPPKLTMSLRR